MTFATKMLPGPTLDPVEDGLERPAPGPEPTPNRDQVAGKKGHSIPPKVALDIELLELSLNTVLCSFVSCRKI